jgi:hypothetical protein
MKIKHIGIYDQHLVRTWRSPCGICAGQSGAGLDFLSSSSVFPCRYHCNAAAYPLMYRLWDGAAHFHKDGITPSQKDSTSSHFYWLQVLPTAFGISVFWTSVREVRLCPGTGCSNRMALLSLLLRSFNNTVSLKNKKKLRWLLATQKWREYLNRSRWP